MAGKVKITLADDHPLTRAGIAEFLKRESSFELVAEAEDGKILCVKITGQIRIGGEKTIRIP